MGKMVRFCGSALDDLRAFPKSAMREAGYQIDKVRTARSRQTGNR